MTKADLKDKITDIFENLFPTSTRDEVDLVPRSLTDGKLYEAYIVTVIAENLSTQENYNLRLINGNHLELKSSPGPINRRYPCIQLLQYSTCRAEIWTDVEYLTLSYANSGRSAPSKGDYHELDILVVDPGLSGRPTHENIWLGVECKNTEYDKALLKDILGVRRELSLLQSDRNTRFTSWPRSTVPAEPPSCLLVYASKREVLDYGDPGTFFGIDFYHEPLPI